MVREQAFRRSGEKTGDILQTLASDGSRKVSAMAEVAGRLAGEIAGGLIRYLYAESEEAIALRFSHKHAGGIAPCRKLGSLDVLGWHALARG